MIDLQSHPHGCILAVRAHPGARRDGIVGVHAGSLKVAVTAPADEGRANDALAKVLADALDLRRAQVELLSGATGRAKRFLLRDQEVEEIRRRIDVLLAQK